MNLIKESLETSLSYQEYRELVSNLLEENKSTTEGGSQALVDYSKLNNSRMKRLDKTTKLPLEIENKIKTIDQPTTWLVISEGWCGDAAQNLPAINKLAEANDNIELRIVLRDKNMELMDEFLTNGNQAIPKLIQIQNDTVNSTWGPRPTIAAQMVLDYKKEHGSLDADFKKDLQIWYNTNKNKSLFADFKGLI